MPDNMGMKAEMDGGPVKGIVNCIKGCGICCTVIKLVVLPIIVISIIAGNQSEYEVDYVETSLADEYCPIHEVHRDWKELSKQKWVSKITQWPTGKGGECERHVRYH